MIVECPKCHAKYRIPEEKLKGRTGPLKVKCKKCGAVITVEPPREDSQWYIAEKGERKGPFSLGELQKLVERGEVGPDTFIWTKGFASWKKAQEVPELASLFENEEEVEETQMLDSETIKRLTGEFEAQQEGKEGEEEGLLWQRHETSVLFSLDNYKPGMRTAGQSNAVIDLGGEIPETPEGATDEGPEVPPIGEISLDEQEVAQVKEVLEQSKAKKTKTIMFAVAGVVVLVLAVVAFLILGGKKESPERISQRTNNKVKHEVTSKAKKAIATPTKKTSEIKEKKKTLAKKEEKPTEKEPEKAQKQAEKGEKEQKVAEKPKEEASSKKAASKVAVKASSKKTSRKWKKAENTKVKVSVKKRVVPVSKPSKKSSGGEAAAILNALHEAKKKEKPAAGPAVSDENLPQTLPMAVVNRIMSRAKGKIKRCLVQGGIDLGDNPVIMSKLTITGKGSVQSVSITGKAGSAVGCIKNVLRNLKFPRFKKSTMIVRYPYMF